MSLVTISVCDLALQNHQLVEIVPYALLQQLAPRVLFLVDHDWNYKTHELLLPLRSLEHVDDINKQGLQLLFSHWRRGGSMSALTTSTTMPVGTDVLIYRAFQLLQMDVAAETLRTRLMRRMHHQPLSEVDVQNIWWAFKRDGDWRDWLEAVYYNIARFRLAKRKRTGVYIQQFIYVELLQLTQEQRDFLSAVEEKHAAQFSGRQGWRRFWHCVTGCLS